MLIVTTESKEHTLLELKTQLPLRCFDVLSELCLKHGWHVNTIALLYAHYDEFIPYDEHVQMLGTVRAIAIKGHEIQVHYAPNKLFRRIFARRPRPAADVLGLLNLPAARLLKSDMQTPYASNDLIKPGECVYIQQFKHTPIDWIFWSMIFITVLVLVRFFFHVQP